MISGCTSSAYAAIWVGSGQDVTLRPRDHALVVARHPLGDVGHREVGDDPLADEVEVDAEAAAQLLDGEHHVALADHDALRRAGGAGGVDEGGQVVGGGLGRELVRGRGCPGRAGRPPASTPSGRASAGGLITKICLSCGQLVAHLEDPLEEPAVLDDRDLRLGVAGQVLDLLGGRRVVDAHGRGPQELRGGVEPVEVGPVAHHQQHPLPRLRARGAAGPRRPGR